MVIQKNRRFLNFCRVHGIDHNRPFSHEHLRLWIGQMMLICSTVNPRIVSKELDILDQDAWDNWLDKFSTPYDPNYKHPKKETTVTEDTCDDRLSEAVEAALHCALRSANMLANAHKTNELKEACKALRAAIRKEYTLKPPPKRRDLSFGTVFRYTGGQRGRVETACITDVYGKPVDMIVASGEIYQPDTDRSVIVCGKLGCVPLDGKDKQ